MKNCKTCNEFMCGFSHTDRISEYCGATEEVMPVYPNGNPHIQ